MRCQPDRAASLVVVVATALLLPTFHTTASAGDVSVAGYVKSYASAYHYPDYTLAAYPTSAPPLGAVSNRLRLKVRWPIARWISADVAYELDARTQDRSFFAEDAIAGAVGRIYRVDDLERRFYPGSGDRVSSFGLYQNLDRAQLAIRVGRLDLYVGRQAIAWGSARVVNPTDIFIPFSYGTLDTEDRVGVDAVRARLAIGFMSELDVGLVGGGDFKAKNSAAYVRYKTYVARTDIAALVAGFREHLMAGVDLTRAIGEAGGWLEAAYVWPYRLQPDTDRRPDGYWRASVGADYSLGPNTYGFVEYHYNQPGASNAAEYASLAANPAYVDGAVYLLGEHYVTPGIQHQLTALVTATSEVLFNASDGSAYFLISLEYSLAENVYLAGGGYVGLGKGPEAFDRLKSEFGAYPDTFYSAFRYYF